MVDGWCLRAWSCSIGWQNIANHCAPKWNSAWASLYHPLSDSIWFYPSVHHDPPRPHSNYLFLGDYVDRGPNAQKVTECNACGTEANLLNVQLNHVQRDLIWVDDSWWTCLYACNRSLVLRSRGKVDDLQANRVSRPSCCFLPTRCDFRTLKTKRTIRGPWLMKELKTVINVYQCE